MKTILFIGLTLLLQNAHAQLLKKNELVRKTLAESFVDHVKVRPLSEELLQAWNDKFDYQNLRRDNFKERIDYTSIFPIQETKVHHINGSRVYYGLAKKKYRYRITQDKDRNELIANIKIHFYPSKKYLRKQAELPDDYLTKDQILRKFRLMVKDAEDIWNTQSPDGIRFKFDYEPNASKADYKVKISTTLGALYDKFFFYGFGADTLAHEIGHMLGLDDEYTLVTSNVLPVHEIIHKVKTKEKNFEYTAYQDMRCHLESLMCLRSTLYPYHFEHIFGRIPLN